MLEIVYENEQLIAINKPHGLLVHRTRIAADAREFAVQMLRDQVGAKVYPIHRLDRKTSGVLLFAKDPATCGQVQRLFRERKIRKCYKAIVRGHLSARGRIDYPLREGDKIREAITDYELIEHFEIPVPHGKFETSRYSLAALFPRTGRHHQLRKHLAHIFHPIIGDRPHGCNKQNRLWKERFAMTNMLLHAESLHFQFAEGQDVQIYATLSSTFQEVLHRLRC